MIAKIRIVIFWLVVFLILLFAASSAAQQNIDWATQADSLLVHNGQQFSLVCPAVPPLAQ